MTVMTHGSNGSWSRSGSVAASGSPHGSSLRAHFAHLAIPIFVLFLCLAAYGNVGTYRTTFPAIESPISENTYWTNGQAEGTDWKDMQTTAGLAFGTQVNSQTFDDSTAVLTGDWGPNQFVQAKVKIVKPCNATDYEEVELRTNSTISAHSITGYEFDYRCGGGARAYAVIVRWNGPFGDFTYIANNGVHGAKYEVHDGDVITAVSQRNNAGCPVLTLLKNSVVLAGPVTDCTYPNGAPGMGMALGSFGGGGVASDYGFSSFMASDSFRGLTSASPHGRLTGDWPTSGIVPTRNTTTSSWQRTKGQTCTGKKREISRCETSPPITTRSFYLSADPGPARSRSDRAFGVTDLAESRPAAAGYPVRVADRCAVDFADLIAGLVVFRHPFFVSF